MATKKASIRDLPVLPTDKTGPKEWVPTEKEIASIKMMASVDFTEAVIAGCLRISTVTFIAAKAKYPEIVNALKYAKKDTEHGLIKQIMDFINDPEVPYERKRKDIQFVLGRKHGWKEAAVDNSDKQHLPGTIVFEQVEKIEREAEPE